MWIIKRGAGRYFDSPGDGLVFSLALAHIYNEVPSNANYSIHIPLNSNHHKSEIKVSRAF
ncbi:hypothetical protein [Vibrio phage vB_VpaP_SJSY21]|nr:hypothetical protein [Vibrio phage vB_VpaP_SJSY21]